VCKVDSAKCLEVVLFIAARVVGGQIIFFEKRVTEIFFVV